MINNNFHKFYEHDECSKNTGMWLSCFENFSTLFIWNYFKMLILVGLEKQEGRDIKNNKRGVWRWCVRVPTCSHTQVCAHVVMLNIHEKKSKIPWGEGICMSSKLLCQDYEYCQFEQMDPAQFTLYNKSELILLDFGSQIYKPNLCLSSLDGHLKLGILYRRPTRETKVSLEASIYLFIQHMTETWGDNLCGGNDLPL